MYKRSTAARLAGFTFSALTLAMAGVALAADEAPPAEHVEVVARP